MSQMTLNLTDNERDCLLELLESTLKQVRVEEHRTRTPIYREGVIQREEIIANVLEKLGHLHAAQVS